ncbi:MAG: CPBP family intramembrane metalloprotease [Candidatus Lokiarchaeota archaeon]|nr:CPBP family intramembrane metalloprotease [Candidatus Harpocratesius repetitus]
MGLDLAQNVFSFFIFCIIELLFILIPMLVFKFQKKNLKYEFRHRIIPNERLHRSWKLRVVDVLSGVTLGVLFYYIGSFMAKTIKKIIIQLKGEDFYHAATTGSVNTTPPPPPPNPFLIWAIIVVGVALMYMTVALSEEFCYRGVILKEIGHKSKFWALILSSGFFMIYHVFPGIVPWATFLTFWSYYFTFGLLLGGITLFQKGDLITSIIAHGTFNSILWVQLYLPYL